MGYALTTYPYFDADGNGQIDPDEWQTVLAAAEQWVDADIRAQQRLPGTHVMSGAQAGQLFLMATAHIR